MKCLNCGSENDTYLCEHCRTEEILDRVFRELCYYKPDICENPYIIEFVNGQTEKYAERDCIPEILALFDENTTEYYFCRYYRAKRDPLFEKTAIGFLTSHKVEEKQTQFVLHDLLQNYLLSDFIKPRKWCDIIAKTDKLCGELYEDAAKYYGMIGEYALSDQVVEKALKYCSSDSEFTSLFCSREGMTIRLNKQKATVETYRTKKPYWPQTEERRRAVAMFYDEKGIAYPRIESRPQKVPEDRFMPIQECSSESLQSYCAFWCSEAFGPVSVKCIYEISAIRVQNGTVKGNFSSLVRPWDGISYQKSAAKHSGLPLETIQQAEDVDIVLKRFFDFVGDDVLVSTDALGSQAKLLSRAARYAGMAEIKNAFYDLLDLAAVKDPDFDFSNNTREYLLQHFSIREGTSSLEKARVNVMLYEKLSGYGGRNG